MAPPQRTTSIAFDNFAHRVTVAVVAVVIFHTLIATMKLVVSMTGYKSKHSASKGNVIMLSAKNT